MALGPGRGLLLMLALAPAARADENFLAPEVAFKPTLHMVDASTAELRFDVADGYYMYRERFHFSAPGGRIGQARFPKGKVKFDETFQKDVETYRGSVSILIPQSGTKQFLLEVSSQGCSDKGLCYAPMTSKLTVDPAAVGAPAAAAPAQLGTIAATLQGGSLLAIMPMFLLLGLGLAFTPCVLPMLPILSSIIVGDRQRGSRLRGLALSATYSLGMAIVYTLLGVAAGLAGEGLAAALQNGLVLSGFALLMATLSLSMFGLFELQMPPSIQARLIGASSKQSVGSHAGVFVMGALSALIVGPCVAAPLAGALVYISQTRDALTGAAALFAMAAGMSVPLLAIGGSAGAVLPRPGPWMDTIKRFFGVLMLATALWIVSPVISPRLQMAGWAALAIGYAISLAFGKASKWRARAVAIGFAGLGAAQLAGVATGADDPLAPLAAIGHRPENATRFKRIVSVGELEAVLASAPGKPVMLDFYADWCVSCKEMEKDTFADARIRSRFDKMLLLQVDVSANSGDDKELLKRFGLFGPPGIIFFDATGKELIHAKVVGYQPADQFLISLAAAQQSLPAANHTDFGLTKHKEIQWQNQLSSSK
ncbi:protein-disulfide reductase DsbD [Massilia sp. TWR1-2-2]|uniref:protein-disulfide reductase DsbD n=1 Tax=Massilia sp. TWR1-2-2 TaxID=2804584 RepID=UPI003CE7E431